MRKNKKVIVITGGNSGLGKATAKILTGLHHKVVILGRNSKEVVKVAKELKCDGIICDVTDEEQVREVFSEIIHKYKRADCLINCAGVWIEGPIEKNDPEDIKNVISANTLGTIFTVNALVPQFKKQKFGRIINVISQAGLYGKSERSVYNASKWAITGFTKSMQLELAPFNISVTGFYPGFIHTKLFDKARNWKTDFSTAMPAEKTARTLAYLAEIDSDLVVKEFVVQSIKQL